MISSGSAVAFVSVTRARGIGKRASKIKLFRARCNALDPTCHSVELYISAVCRLTLLEYEKGTDVPRGWTNVDTSTRNESLESLID